MRQRSWLLIFVCLALTLWAATGCGEPASDANAPAEPNLTGRTLLWHDYTGKEAAALNRLLAKYQEVNPGTEIIAVYVAPRELLQTVTDFSDGGLGPDLVLTGVDMLDELVARGLVQDLSGQAVDTRRFLPSALESVSKDGKVYALPFSLHTQVLFYNKNLAETPPASLHDLVDEVANGQRAALSASFSDAFWGLGTFDGQAFDTAGRITLTQGAFVNWLDFLQSVQSLPGFIIDEDPQRLRDAFLSGEVAYYAGDSSQLSILRETLGDALGVAQLPVGSSGRPPTPVLQADVFAFNSAASPDETALALALADYLTNLQAQFRLATDDIGYAPASAKVRVAQSLPEATTEVMRQVRTARPIALRFRGLWDEMSQPDSAFSDGYRKVLAGLVPSNEFVRRTLWQIAARYGIELAPSASELNCSKQATPITIWHTLQADEAQALEQLAQQFVTTCPGANVTLTAVATEEIYDRYVAASKAGTAPDALFTSSRWLARLADAGLLLDLDDRIPRGAMQQFSPGAAEAMRHKMRTYGIPASISLLALYYNRGLVQKTPNDLDELLASVDADKKFEMPARFYTGFWGLAPYGGFNFDPQTGEITNREGLNGWLAWLQSAQKLPGIELPATDMEAEDEFAAGRAAYLVSGPWSLARLRQDLGPGAFGVVPLPDGPLGAGTPMLQADGIMVNAKASSTAADTALAFAKFVNLPESQVVFLQTGIHVPAVVNLDMTGYSQIEGFIEQAKTAAPVNENARFTVIEDLGNKLYTAVLRDGADPTTAVDQYVADVNAANAAP